MDMPLVNGLGWFERESPTCDRSEKSSCRGEESHTQLLHWQRYLPIGARQESLKNCELVQDIRMLLVTADNESCVFTAVNGPEIHLSMDA